MSAHEVVRGLVQGHRRRPVPLPGVQPGQPRHGRPHRRPVRRRQRLRRGGRRHPPDRRPTPWPRAAPCWSPPTTATASACATRRATRTPPTPSTRCPRSWWPPGFEATQLRAGGALADVAPTLLKLMGAGPADGNGRRQPVLALRQRPLFRPSCLPVGFGSPVFAPTHRCVRALPQPRRLRLLRVRQGLTLPLPRLGWGFLRLAAGGRGDRSLECPGSHDGCFEFCSMKRRRIDSSPGGRSSVAACIARSAARTLQADHAPMGRRKNPEPEVDRKARRAERARR